MTTESEALTLQRDWIVACEVARDTGDALRRARAAHVIAQAYRKSAYLAYAASLGWDIEDPMVVAIASSRTKAAAPNVEDVEAAAEVPSEDTPQVTVGEAVTPALDGAR